VVDAPGPFLYRRGTPRPYRKNEPRLAFPQKWRDLLLLALAELLVMSLWFSTTAVTARDTLNWHKTQPPERQTRLRAGITAERETNLPTEWHTRNG